MTPPPTASGTGTAPAQSLDRRYLLDNFVPGRWLDRRQASASTFSAVAGTYERTAPKVGGFCWPNLHYFDMRLAVRAAASKGRLVDHQLDAQPLGEVIFVPAGHRYRAGGGPGIQRNFFLFLDAGPEALEASAHPRDCMNLRSERIKQLLTQICREIYDPGFASPLLLEGLGITLQAETQRLLHHEHQRQQGRGGLSPIQLRRIRERVLDGEALPSIAELAATCNLSRRHLMRAFRQETGQTVGQYVQQLAMEKARQLLKDTDQPVAAIAAAVGFASPAAFATAFRRATGDSPRTYRAIQRGLRATTSA